MNQRFTLATLALTSLLLAVSSQANTLQKLEKNQIEDEGNTKGVLDQPTNIEDIQVDKNIQRQADSQIQQNIRFKLNSINVQGNQTLSNEEIIKVAKPYAGKMVTSNELKLLAQQITQLFHAKGYTTSRCVIPAQQIKNGVVMLQVEENKLNQIHIRGENSFEYDKKLFLRHLNDLTGKIIHAPTLKQRLARLTFLPSARITPKLQSAGFGKTDLILHIEDVKATKLLSLYNNASRLTGDLRLNLSGLFVNPTGSGDYLQLGASIDPAESKNFSSITAKYATPFGNEGGRINVQYADIRYRVSDDIIDSSTFEIGGSSQLLKLTFNKPLEYGNAARWEVGVEHKVTANEQIQHVNFNELVPVVNLDECPTGEIVEQQGVNYCVFDDANLLAGFKWLDTEETIVMLSVAVSDEYKYNLFDRAAYTQLSAKFSKALEGAFGGLTQAQINDKFKNKNAQTSNNEIVTLTGPVGNDALMQADFWKLYLDLTHYSRLSENSNLIVSSHFEYSPEKAIPGSYKYGAADSGIWGGDIDISYQYIWNSNWQASVGYHVESAVNFTSEKDYPDADGDGKVRHLTCNLKEVEVNAYFACTVNYPYIRTTYDSGAHRLSATLRTQPKTFESRENALSLGYVYRF
ncbi:POTRA domain-containing protein [Catenovulum sediminis]|uniref:POTRA domain-containing protein n=1 Tax=Catenovulum sediminis TaxID=1740262 RepID=A0ABV1RFM2_9ALTE|nr:POTRA domain-containing protein [Catenovulum sediminis]